MALAQMQVSEALNNHLADCQAAYADNNAWVAGLPGSAAMVAGSATVLSADKALLTMWVQH